MRGMQNFACPPKTCYLLKSPLLKEKIFVPSDSCSGKVSSFSGSCPDNNGFWIVFRRAGARLAAFFAVVARRAAVRLAPALGAARFAVLPAAFFALPTARIPARALVDLAAADLLRAAPVLERDAAVFLAVVLLAVVRLAVVRLAVVFLPAAARTAAFLLVAAGLAAFLFVVLRAVVLRVVAMSSPYKVLHTDY